ncbi:MAG: hypothetical protein ACLGI9_17035 [Thermoanaerobaculia bacterium]
MNQDLEHLRLLSIFHYVVAGLAGLVSCIPLIQVVMGLLMASGWGSSQPPEDPVPWLMGWFFVAFASTITALIWAYAICLALAGTYLARRTHYTFCLVMAAISCTFMPLGTALGIFTLIVLLRPSVRALFGLPVEAPPAPVP